MPAVIAALTAIDQLRGARETMRAIGDYLKNNVSVPPEVLSFLNKFREFFASVADLIFFWVPINLRSMLLVVTILFGEAVIHYLTFFVASVVRRLAVLIFGPASGESKKAVIEECLVHLDEIGDLIRDAIITTPNINLSPEQLVALQGADAAPGVRQRIVDKRGLQKLAKRHAQRVAQEESRLDEIEAATADLNNDAITFRFVQYLRSNPPQIPVNKYALIVGTLVLCIGVNYLVYPISAERFTVIVGDPLREMKLQDYMAHRSDYFHHVTLALVYSIPVLIFIAVTAILSARDEGAGADTPAAVLAAIVVSLSAIAGWDELGVLSPALCVGFCIAMYIIAAGVFIIRNFTDEASWLTRK